VKTFYCEQDSDNESDFEVMYEQGAGEEFQDLKPIKKPLYLSELVMSLQSENHEKFTLAVDSAEDLIRKQTLNDLA
jgi:hypothetical protein